MAIKELLIERKQITLEDLSRHFDLSEEIMVGMLEHWQKKGNVEMVDASGACGTMCGSCDESESSRVYYRWKPIAEKPIFIKNGE